MKFESYDKTAEVLQPGEQALNLPAASIAPQRSSVLRFASFLPVRGNHFNAPILFQLGVKLVAVVGLVADQAVRELMVNVRSKVSSTRVTS